MYFKKSVLPYLLLLSIAALAFFQVVFFVHPPNFDMVDCFYPWRFHVGECFQNGIFPFWNPYQDLGYPIYSDPSSGAWYPVVWLIGSTVGYNLYTIGFEFYIHVFFAGVGMYWLAQTLNFDKRIALLAAVSYMLCGIFVGNAQHLPYIIGAAWLPFVLNFYFRLLAEKKTLHAVYTGFFLSLMITGGYPAFVIILFYFFLVSFIYYLIKLVRDKEKNGVFVFFKNHAVFVITALILSGGMLISIYQVSPYLSRLEGFTLEEALYSPFAPKAFISFVLPFATVDFSEIFKGDISMINGYFGLFMLFFLIAGIFTPKNTGLKFILVLGVFSLLAAVGDALPIRELLYKYVPMMNVFRFPAIFRIFALFAFILVAANYLNVNYKKGQFLAFKKWILPMSIVLLTLITLIIYIRSNSHLDMKNFVAKAIFAAHREGQIGQFIVFQAGIQIGFIIALLLVIRFVKKVNRAYILLGVLITVDLIFAAQLNGPYMVYTDFLKSKDAHHATAQLEKGFPPLQTISIAEAGNLPGLGQPYWLNVNTFQKEISAEGFNSFSFFSYENLEREHSFIYKTIQHNRVLLLSDKVLHEENMDRLNADSTFQKDDLFFDNQAYRTLIAMDLKNDSTDTAIITDYTANKFHIATENKKTQLLTIFQKEFTGWEAVVDGKKVPIYKSNKNFMTIVLPAGSKNVTFQYRNPIILIAFSVSLISCLLLLFYTIIKGVKQFRGSLKIVSNS